MSAWLTMCSQIQQTGSSSVLLQPVKCQLPEHKFSKLTKTILRRPSEFHLSLEALLFVAVKPTGDAIMDWAKRAEFCVKLAIKGHDDPTIGGEAATIILEKGNKNGGG
jgi:hypothetical protein